jgi:hypothetical protein
VIAAQPCSTRLPSNNKFPSALIHIRVYFSQMFWDVFFPDENSPRLTNEKCFSFTSIFQRFVILIYEINLILLFRLGEPFMCFVNCKKWTETLKINPLCVRGSRGILLFRNNLKSHRNQLDWAPINVWCLNCVAIYKKNLSFHRKIIFHK